MTVFLGAEHPHHFKDGIKYRRGVKVYDWSQNKYITQKAMFSEPRQNSACAIMKSEFDYHLAGGVKYRRIIQPP